MALPLTLEEALSKILSPRVGNPQNLDIAVWIGLFKAILDMKRLPHGKATFAGDNDQALGSLDRSELR